MDVVYAGDSQRDLARVIGDNSEANSRLIAAAPDLLEALKKCQSELRKLSFKDQSIVMALESAYSAIDKATGE